MDSGGSERVGGRLLTPVRRSLSVAAAYSACDGTRAAAFPQPLSLARRLPGVSPGSSRSSSLASFRSEEPRVFVDPGGSACVVGAPVVPAVGRSRRVRRGQPSMNEQPLAWHVVILPPSS